MKVIKRDGTEVAFDKNKIIKAVSAANSELAKIDEIHVLSNAQIKSIANVVEKECESFNRALEIDTIQELIEKTIMEHRGYEVAQLYIRYRYKRDLKRKSNTTDGAIISLVNLKNETAKQENSNKNPIINSTQRDYIAGEVSKDITDRILLDEDIVKAHNDGILHFHDKDYFITKEHNCCLVNLEDMLQNGTVISGRMIEKPKSLLVAGNVSTQIVAQVASSQYGGQTISMAHLAPFVDVSRQKIRQHVKEETSSNGIALTETQLEGIVASRLKEEIKQCIQTIQYQIETLMTTNGQTPFVTIFLCMEEAKNEQERKDLALLIEELLNQRIHGIKNEMGVLVTPAFPKLIFTLDEYTKEGGEYEYLSELAARCTAKRMVPDYISAKKMRELKGGDLYPCMGCRSFLTVDRSSEKNGNVAKAMNYEEGKRKYYGRFNQGVVTINLVDVACSSARDEEKFWAILEERLELCHRALRARHDRLLGTPSDVAPILWQHGALARLEKGETIDKLLYGGYSTLSLGYAGLYEMCFYMKGVSHTSEDGKPFALAVMQKLNDKCAEWKAQEDIDYSVYGTPLESTTYKFAKCLQNRFGIVDGVTDHNYITNSYHVNVREEIDAFSKLEFESDFQALSPGGAISYVEVPNLTHNIPAVRSVMNCIEDTIMYAELNTKSDYCMECGYDGEIVIVEEDNKLLWECPKCHNRNESKMSVARRTCGYIGTQFWNQGRTQEIRDRVMHL